jgi:hypothetical protein
MAVQSELPRREARIRRLVPITSHRNLRPLRRIEAVGRFHLGPDHRNSPAAGGTLVTAGVIDNGQYGSPASLPDRRTPTFPRSGRKLRAEPHIRVIFQHDPN